MPRPLISAALLVAALSAAAACRQIAGIKTRDSVQTGCVSCIDTACAADVSACAASPSCASRLDCSLGCDPLDAACDRPCESQTVSDVVPLGALVSCRATSCAAACSVACGGVLPVAPPQAATACAICVSAQCCSSAAACAASADCVRGLECARGMAVPDGVVACTDSRYAGGATAYHAFDDCVAGSCSDECKIGANWSCVGHVSIPAPSANAVRFTLDVVQASSQSVPVPALTVRACSASDAACVTPAAPPVTTDANGAASLLLPTNADGSRRGFYGYFEVIDPAGVYSTGLGFASVPLTQDGATATIIAPTVSLGQTLSAVVGLTYDPMQGAVIMTVTDCTNVPAPRVTLELQAPTGSQHVYYTANGFPSVSAKMTDTKGTGLAANVPPGTVTVTATSVDLGEVVGRAQILTRAGAVSFVRLTPTP